MPSNFNDTSDYPNFQRVSDVNTIVFDAAGSLSTAFQMFGYAGGAVLVNSGFEGVIHFQMSVDGTNYAPYDDSSGSAIYAVVSASGTASVAKWVELPDKLFPAIYLKLITYTDTTRGTAKNQTSAGTLTVALKS